MLQLLHLLTVNLASRTALTTWLDGRWTLPIVVAPETTRVGAHVSAWLRERNFDGQPVGQWMGRASPNGGVDWLVVADASSQPPVPSASTLRWTCLDDLRTSPSVLEYQQWVVAQVLAGRDVPSVPGPFGEPTWFAEVMRWIARALGGRLGSTKLGVIAHRLSAYEVVLECRGPAGRWFFKGLAADRAAEAPITRTFAKWLPGSFARTAALEGRPDGSTWWLMESCPGAPLSQRITLDSACRVVEASAQVQQAIADRILAGGTLPAVDLSALASRAASLLGEGIDRPAPAASRTLIDEACRLLSSDLPWSWVAPDLDPTNVIVDGEEVLFIDLDDALIGPAPLAIGTFARRVARALGRDGWTPVSTARLVDAYERAWTPRLHLSTLWPAIDLVSDLLECDLAWQRVKAKVARGEVRGVREIAQRSLRHRLLKAVERYRGSRAQFGRSTAAAIATGRAASDTTPSRVSQG